MDTKNKIREDIITLYSTGCYSQMEICQKLKIKSQSTVSRIIQLWKKTGSTTSRRFGRQSTNKKTSIRMERAIVRKSVEAPHLTARQIRDSYGQKILNASVRTIQRILRKYGRQAIRPISGPILNSVRKKQRYSWAKVHSNWSKEDWTKVRIIFFINPLLMSLICFIINYLGYFFRRNIY